ncbi:L domain-like protein [Neocallimastix sp. 'constans']
MNIDDNFVYNYEYDEIKNNNNFKEDDLGIVLASVSALNSFVKADDNLIGDYGLKVEKDYDKILSYQTIESLYFNIYDEHQHHSGQFDEIIHCGSMKSLPKALFKLNNLKTLNLYGYNEFKKYEISNLPKSITNISFGDVELKQYVISELSKFTNLESIAFYRTKLNMELDLTPLENLTKINNITLSNDDMIFTTKKYFDYRILPFFKNIHSFFSNLKNLEKLSIIGTTYNCNEDINLFEGYYCPLATIPKSIFNLSKLKEFTTDISSLKNINKLSNLEYLNLDRNYMKSIPSSIGELKNLVFLDLSGNDITEIPSFIGNLSSLEKLILNDNLFTKLPSSIGNLSKLKYFLEILHLLRCNLLALPDSMGNLKKLKQLQMSENNLTKIPEVLSKINKNLKYLYLYYNNSIRGKTLTNESLIRCDYLPFDIDISKVSLCKPKDMDCFEEDERKLKYCSKEDSTTSTNKTTINTSKTATTNTTKKTTTNTTEKTTSKTTKKSTTKETTTKKTTTKTTKKTTPKETTTKKTTSKTTKKSTTKETTTKKTTSKTTKKSTTKTTKKTTPKETTFKKSTTNTTKKSTTKKTTTIGTITKIATTKKISI